MASSADLIDTLAFNSPDFDSNFDSDCEAEIAS